MRRGKTARALAEDFKWSVTSIGGGVRSAR
jgi:hypothetical protein